MNTLYDYDEYEKYLDYEEPPTRPSRKGGQQRKKKTTAVAPIAELTDFDDNVSSWVPSYAAALDPQHHERQWVVNAVATFYQQSIITDVTRLVKGGKEANVYVCTAHPATGFDLLAAKLYRERMLRNLKNDAIYKEGRILRDAQGKQIRNDRERRAIINKTGYGRQVDFMMWVGTEYRTQAMLYEAGADVPKPIAQSGSTILMEFIGDTYGAAPALNEVSLPTHEATTLLQRVLDNVVLMLQFHLVHGDLSAYNILYWEGDVYLIDFPQVVDARNNPHAFELLQRDISRVCDYFARFGATADPVDIALTLWEQYMHTDQA